MTTRQVNFYTYIRSQAGDVNTPGSEILSDAIIDVIISALAFDDNGVQKVSAIAVARDYARRVASFDAQTKPQRSEEFLRNANRLAARYQNNPTAEIVNVHAPGGPTHIGDYITQDELNTAVGDAITAHAGMPNVHHTPPTVDAEGNAIATWDSLGGFKDLDSVGPADVTGSADVPIYTDDQRRMSFGAFSARVRQDIQDTDIPGGIARDSEIPAPSDDTPHASTVAVGNAGTSAEYSRGDHRHQAPAGGGGGATYSFTAPLNESSGTVTIRHATSTQSGIIGPQEYAEIKNAVDEAHLHDTPKLTESALDDHDAILLDDESVADGQGSQLKEIYISELDKRWRQMPSDATPHATIAGTGNAGTSANYSRADHTHQDLAGAQGALDSVASDATLDGAGTTTSPLGVARPLSKIGKDYTDEIGGDGWQLLAGAVGSTAHQNPPSFAQQQTFTYADFYTSGNRWTNYWFDLRIPEADGDELGNLEVRVGPSDGLSKGISARIDLATSQELTHTGTAGGYDYYRLQIADKPAGSAVVVMIHRGFELPMQNVELTGLPAASELTPDIVGLDSANRPQSVSRDILDNRYKTHERPPLVDALPDNPMAGFSVTIFGVKKWAKYAVLEVTQSGEQKSLVFSPAAPLPGVTGTTVGSIQSYSSAFTGPSDSELNGKTFLLTGGSHIESGLDLTARINGIDHAVNAGWVSRSLQPYHEIPNLNFSGPDPNFVLRVGQANVRLHNSKGDAWPADGEIGRPAAETIVTYVGNQTWVYDARFPAWWAREGMERPHDIVGEVVTTDLTAGSPFSTANASGRGSAPTTVTPNIKPAEHANDYFTGYAIRSLTSAFTNIAYGNGARVERVNLSFQGSDITHTFDGTAAVQGLVLASGTTLQGGSTLLYTGNLRGVIDASGNLQFIADTDTESGLSLNPAVTGSDSWDVRLWRFPTGAAAAAGGGQRAWYMATTWTIPLPQAARNETPGITAHAQTANAVGISAVAHAATESIRVTFDAAGVYQLTGVLSKVNAQVDRRSWGFAATAIAGAGTLQEQTKDIVYSNSQSVFVRERFGNLLFLISQANTTLQLTGSGTGFGRANIYLPLIYQIA